MDGLPRKHIFVVVCRPTAPQRALVELLQPVSPGAALQSLGLIRTALYDPEVRAASPPRPRSPLRPTAPASLALRS